MNFNDMPTDDTYTFKIYDGAGQTDNMPVNIGGSYNGGDTIFDVYVNGTFNPTNGTNLNNAKGDLTMQETPDSPIRLIQKKLRHT